MGYTVFYVAEERAMAPGIGDPWPAVVPNPLRRFGGRLRRLPEGTCREIAQLVYGSDKDAEPGRMAVGGRDARG